MRIHTEMPSSRMDDQERDAPAPVVETASPMTVRVPRMTSSDRNRPSVAVVWIQAV